MRVEDEYLDVLQNIEFAIVNEFRNDGSILDLDAADAVSALVRVYEAEAESRGAPNRQGYIQVGLSVAVDNTRARSLYAGRGYVDAGFGERTVRWTYVDARGEEQMREEVLIYLLKQL